MIAPGPLAAAPMRISTGIRSHTLLTVILLLLITVHSLLMNGFSHSSRFLNVATYAMPIRAQSDPTLFRNSLYVQSLKEKNARLSLMHELIPVLMGKGDLETFSLIQWFICLFLTSAALFFLGTTVAGSPVAGYLTALLFSAELNRWTLGSPAIYINFFHHGLQWAIFLSILSLTLFLKRRLPLACFCMGAAWNFHPMSVIFLVLIFVPCILVRMSELSMKTLGLSILAFMLPALPMSIRTLTYLTGPWTYGPEWMEAVKWCAWYTVFPSTWPLHYFWRAGLYLWLFVMALAVSPPGQVKGALKLFMMTIGILCGLGTVFAEVIPLPFIMKMSLWRTSWLYILVSLPCIAYLFLTRIWDTNLLRRFLVVSTIIAVTGYIHYFPYYYLLISNTVVLLLLRRDAWERKWPWPYRNMAFIFCAVLALIIAYQALYDRGVEGTILGLLAVILFLIVLKPLERSIQPVHGTAMWITAAILFIILFDGSILVYRGGVDIYYRGQVRGRKDPWADIQVFAREHTHKDALFIVPPYMNDFGLYSERATLGDWAEGANILYLDNSFAKQWLERMNALGWKTLWGLHSGYAALSTDEIVAAAAKYGAQYIVSEKPKRFALPSLYENEQFILYRVPHTHG